MKREKVARKRETEMWSQRKRDRGREIEAGGEEVRKAKGEEERETEDRNVEEAAGEAQ